MEFSFKNSSLILFSRISTILVIPHEAFLFYRDKYMLFRIVVIKMSFFEMIFTLEWGNFLFQLVRYRWIFQLFKSPNLNTSIQTKISMIKNGITWLFCPHWFGNKFSSWFFLTWKIQLRHKANRIDWYLIFLQLKLNIHSNIDKKIPFLHFYASL
jgi:hypothetical protein